MGHLIAHWLGIDTQQSPFYDFWSGVGTQLKPGWLWVGFLVYRRHNCHQQRCWRIGKHTVDGTPWCTRHHEQARGSER